MAVIESGWRGTLYRSLMEKPRLQVWLCIGIFWLLVGMFVIPSHKRYEQGIIFLLWLPGGLALLLSEAARRAWWQPLSLAWGLFALWCAASGLWSYGKVDADDYKIFGYLWLSANAFLALGALAPQLLWRILALSGLAGGVLAWVTLVEFYGIRGFPLAERVEGITLLGNPILTAQLEMVLGILLFFLRDYLPRHLRGVVWVLGCVGCVAMLILCQSKGPWLAFFCMVLLLPLWRGQKRLWWLSVAMVTAVVVTLAITPELVTQRGLSYRPEIFRDAWRHIVQHPWTGQGFHSLYQIYVPSLDRYYEHAHNLYLHLAVLYGLVGLALWGLMQALAFWMAWEHRDQVQGQMLCALLCFAVIALGSDGVGPWVKPREEWYCIWLPYFLALVLCLPREVIGRERP